MGLLNAVQWFFTFSIVAGLADLFLSTGPVVGIAVGIVGSCAIAFLYGMFPRLIGALFILSWAGAAHMFILVMRDWTGGSENGSPFLTANVLAIYIIALICGVAANLAQVRELLSLRQAKPDTGESTTST